jgi:ATP-dependent RNA helicase DDX51/DBP6
MCIVFTSSVEETHRLCKLLQIMNDQSSTGAATGGDRLFDGCVEEMSRSVRQEDRVRIMQQCREGDVSVLISSDHMARGIDLTNIRLVVNYEPPKHVRTYVHRVGRTARAGQAGHAITLVSVGQLGDNDLM